MELRSRSRSLPFLISLPDSSIFEVQVKPQSNGLEILSKVCERLGIIETDYFGLLHQTLGKCGEHIWLNLRNPLHCEVNGSSPYRLQLRVKFFIQPHMIQQVSCRQQFYLNVREALDSGHLTVCSLGEAVDIAALIGQIDLGDVAAKLDAGCMKQNYLRTLSLCNCDVDDNAIALVSEAHSKLHGVSAESAKYQFLQAASKLSTYGLQYYAARFARGNCRVHIAVGPEGIIIWDNGMNELNRLPFTAIQKLTHDGQTVVLQAVNDSCETESYQFRLDARLSAGALYRALTEMYYFYRCDTVGSDVMLQYCRDLKGTLVSLFNENSSLGKSYMFDIERTQTEAYDRVRRLLFADGSGMAVGEATDDHVMSSSNCSCRSVDKCQCCQMLHDSVQDMADSLTCRVCADEPINTSFVPCGHTMCCTTCADRLETCPLCKAQITLRLKVFLPWVALKQPSHLDQSLNHVHQRQCGAT